MLKALATRTRFLRAFNTGLLLVLSCAGRGHAQEVQETVFINQQKAAAFCKDLREAVRAQELRKISSWVRNYPIEVQRGGKNILVVDNTDFVSKFNLIFDDAMKSSLFGPSGCESRMHPDGDAGLADDQIILDQVESEAQPYIGEISPPADTDPSANSSNDQYERGAQEFFKKLQRAINAENRNSVALMCEYPTSACIKGKFVTIQNRAELIRNYPQIFTPAVKKAVAKLPAPIHQGWRGFRTDQGELWLDLVVWTHVYRVRSVCSGP